MKIRNGLALLCCVCFLISSCELPAFPTQPTLVPSLPSLRPPQPSATKIPVATRTSLPGFLHTPGAITSGADAARPTLAPAMPTPMAAALPTSDLSINVLIQACDTGIDIFNGMGEVTNAYVTVQNVGGSEATHVVISLSANDEERSHPDKTYIVDHLPAGYEISVKLSVDTKSGTDSTITVNATTDQGTINTASKSSCKSRRPDKDILNTIGELYKAHPIHIYTNP